MTIQLCHNHRCYIYLIFERLGLGLTSLTDGCVHYVYNIVRVLIGNNKEHTQDYTFYLIWLDTYSFYLLSACDTHHGKGDLQHLLKERVFLFVSTACVYNDDFKVLWLEFVNTLCGYDNRIHLCVAVEQNNDELSLYTEWTPIQK